MTLSSLEERADLVRRLRELHAFRFGGGEDYGEAPSTYTEAAGLIEAMDAALTADTDPEVWAQRFHEAYERLAPSFGYETRKASAVPWSAVPEPNKSLMVAVAAEVLALHRARLSDGADDE